MAAISSSRAELFEQENSPFGAGRIPSNADYLNLGNSFFNLRDDGMARISADDVTQSFWQSAYADFDKLPETKEGRKSLAGMVNALLSSLQIYTQETGNVLSRLGDPSDAANGAGLVGHTQGISSGAASVGATPTTLAQILDAQTLNLLVIDSTIDNSGIEDVSTKVIAALSMANGRPVHVPAGTYRFAFPIQGEFPINLVGESADSVTFVGTGAGTGRIFDHNGDLRLRGIRFQETGFVVDGRNLDFVRVLDIKECRFSQMLSAVNTVQAGVDDYASGFGYLVFEFSRNTIYDSLGIVLHLDCRYESGFVDHNFARNIKYAFFWSGAATFNRQAVMRHVLGTHNIILNVTSASSTDTAAAGFQVQGERATLSFNIIEGVSTTFGASGVSAYALYTKCPNSTIIANVLIDVSNPSFSTNAFFIDVKGETPATAGPKGNRVIVGKNILLQSVLSEAVGVNCYSDEIDVVDNKFYGVTTPISTIGSQDSVQVRIINNVMRSPVVAANQAMDLRLSGGAHYVGGNRVSGFIDCIRVRTNANDIEYIELVNNDLIATGRPLSVYDAGGAGSVVNKLVWQGGRAAGVDLILHNQDVLRDVSIDDVDISGITNKALFNGTHSFTRGRISRLRGHSVPTTSASTVNALLLSVAPGSAVFSDVRVLAQSADGPVAGFYCSQKKSALHSREAAGNLALRGTVTTLHDQSNGGSVSLATSGASSLLVQVAGVASKTASFLVDFDILIQPGG